MKLLFLGREDQLDGITPMRLQVYHCHCHYYRLGPTTADCTAFVLRSLGSMIHGTGTVKVQIVLCLAHAHGKC